MSTSIDILLLCDADGRETTRSLKRAGELTSVTDLHESYIKYAEGWGVR